MCLALKLRRTTEIEVQVNCKIFAEGLLEGYHIRPLHRDTSIRSNSTI